jgi:hypothetical protein
MFVGSLRDRKIMNLNQLNILINQLELENNDSNKKLIEFYKQKKVELIKEISKKVNQILKEN